jgi:8-oxo-dGTP diphosphatase
VSCVNGVLPLALNLQKFPTLLVVAAALVDGEGRVLLQQRAPGRAMAGLWVEPGALSPAAFASADNGGRHMLLLLYLCRQWRGEPRPLDASELRWVRTADMAALPMPPADEPLIPLLDRLI